PNAQEVIVVGVEDFATLPDFADKPAQMRTITSQPGSDNLFVSDMTGLLYRVDASGSATVYLDLTDPKWSTMIDGSWRESGIESFALHPEFSQEGKPGYGKIYTSIDVYKDDIEADYPTAADEVHHPSVVLEWTAADVDSAQYDGGMPRELLRIEQPFQSHNGGTTTFNPLSEPGDADYGLLYIAFGDGGSAGDPLNAAQNLSLPQGKILRIDPLGGDNNLNFMDKLLGRGGNSSANGEYGIPSDNPFLGNPDALPEIYAYGLRNPQQSAWDSETGAFMISDIGQVAIEKISLVGAGDNLGWNVWEGSFAFAGNVEGVDETQVRSDPSIRYPIAEYDHVDPLLLAASAVTGLAVVRDSGVAEIEDHILFGDLITGEMFAVPADKQHLYNGQSENHRVLFDDGSGEVKTLLQIVQETYSERGLEPPFRMDLRFASGADNQVYLLNKYDGIIRRIVSP
ncbi:MAG: PQQ-dependent sugar dehydrogenase, partial [Pseudomonadales bacterium]